jgi:hypothetical protein
MQTIKEDIECAKRYLKRGKEASAEFVDSIMWSRLNKRRYVLLRKAADRTEEENEEYNSLRNIFLQVIETAYPFS